MIVFFFQAIRNLNKSNQKQEQSEMNSAIDELKSYINSKDEQLATAHKEIEELNKVVEKLQNVEQEQSETRTIRNEFHD